MNCSLMLLVILTCSVIQFNGNVENNISASLIFFLLVNFPSLFFENVSSVDESLKHFWIKAFEDKRQHFLLKDTFPFLRIGLTFS